MDTHEGECTVNREPCRVRDDPYYDYSDYVEGEGVYASKPEDNADDLRDIEFDRQQVIDLT